MFWRNKSKISENWRKLGGYFPFRLHYWANIFQRNPRDEIPPLPAPFLKQYGWSVWTARTRGVILWKVRTLGEGDSRRGYPLLLWLSSCTLSSFPTEKRNFHSTSGCGICLSPSLLLAAEHDVTSCHEHRNL